VFLQNLSTIYQSTSRQGPGDLNLKVNISLIEENSIRNFSGTELTF